MEDNFPKLVAGLEQPAEIFYSRISPREAQELRDIVEDVSDYMRKQSKSFLIAGVGGILRYPHPKMAKDIDLAIVGLDYRNLDVEHPFQRVIAFTQAVQEYFETLGSKLALERGNYREGFFAHGSGECFRRFSGGSGPFEREDRSYQAGEGKQTATLDSNIERFGWWGSKGLQLAIEGIRPIDIQFTHNLTIEEWKSSQETLKESPAKAHNYETQGLFQTTPIPQFPYAILKSG